MLQSVFVGKAQKVCSELSIEQSSDYEEVKALVLTAYELVPESYRQKFRNWKRRQGQTYVDYSKEKELWFDRWYRSLGEEKNFGRLREVILLEEFKNHIPLRSEHTWMSKALLNCIRLVCWRTVMS